MNPDDDVILGGTPAAQPPTLVLSSEQVLIEGELQPAVLSIQNGTVHQVWWGSADPARAKVSGETVALGERVVLPGVVETQLGAAPPTSTVRALEHARAAADAARARGELRPSVGFWGGAVPGNAEELEQLWAAGVLGFRCSLAGPGEPGLPPLAPDELLDAMGRIAWFGGLLAAQAEGPAALAGLLDAVRETGARTHVPHVSSARALDLIAEAQDDGLPVTAGICHHTLVVDVEDHKDGDQDALWDALCEGLIDCVDGARGKFAALAGAARRRGVPLADVSRWTSANTAALVGLDRGPRRTGVIAEGAVADLIVYDPDTGTTLQAGEMPVKPSGASIGG